MKITRRSHLVKLVVQNVHASSQRLKEALFFGLKHVHHARCIVFQARVGIPHHFNQSRNKLVKKRLFATQLVAMPNRAADDAALHVAASVAGRNHAVAHQKRSGTDVVGNHAQALVVQISATCFTRSSLDQRVKNINFVIAVHMLQDGGQALQAHAGVNARCGQLDQAAIRLHVELHEHVVPDLDEAVAVFARAAGGATGDVLAVVIKDLAARAAGAGVGHHPEIVGCIFFAFVVANADDALGRQADFFGPDVVGFLVVNVDRGSEFFSRQLVDLREQFPAPLERVALEVVAKAPVTQHFEKRVMARGVAHVFQVVVFAPSTQAGLHRCSAHVRAFVSAQKQVLELHHARIDEHQRRVVAGHQRT